MIKIIDIFNIIDAIAPFNEAEEYDNVGLIIGDLEDEVKGILICLDVTAKAIDLAIDRGCNLVISHHPIIFKEFKKFTSEHPDYKLISKIIKNNINILSAHTNYDKCSISNSIEMAKKLGADKVYLYPDNKLAAVAEFNNPISYDDAIERLKIAYNDKYFRNYRNNMEKIYKIVLIGGSGGRDEAFLLHIGKSCDILVSSEFKYSNVLLAEKIGLNICEVGHLESEIIFVKTLINYLKSAPQLNKLFITSM